jgi:co-chaperonin GroES (HSP10)
MKHQQEPYDWQTTGKVKAMRNRVIVRDMEHGETRTAGGIIITDDTSVERGIRPRWATVYAIGEGVTEVKVGDRVLISHGRWTRGVSVTHKGKSTVIRMVEVESILGVAAH